MPTPEPPSVFHFEKVAWDDPTSALDPNAPGMRELARSARATGARRKKIVRGECGFFMNRSVMPANFRVPPHHHDHDESLCGVRGVITFHIDGVDHRLGPGDRLMLPRGTVHAATAGPDGATYLIGERG